MLSKLAHSSSFFPYWWCSWSLPVTQQIMSKLTLFDLCISCKGAAPIAWQIPGELLSSCSAILVYGLLNTWHGPVSTHVLLNHFHNFAVRWSPCPVQNPLSHFVLHCLSDCFYKHEFDVLIARLRGNFVKGQTVQFFSKLNSILFRHFNSVTPYFSLISNQHQNRMVSFSHFFQMIPSTSKFFKACSIVHCINQNKRVSPQSMDVIFLNIVLHQPWENDYHFLDYEACSI